MSDPFMFGVLKGSRAKIIFGDPISTANIGIGWDKTGGPENGRMAVFKATKGLLDIPQTSPRKVGSYLIHSKLIKDNSKDTGL